MPHLVTAQTGPLQQLEATLLRQVPDIEAWFRSQWQKHKPPFYSSVDLRNAGFKLAPVDTNLFP
ncbi:MAG TPA: glutamate--cysteine ligase, partial [Solimonas sp.]